jgi:Leucine-rich repeat (LRR) protein
MKDIHIHGYYITSNNPTEKVPLEPQDEFFLYKWSLIELVLPKCRDVYCYNNQLTDLYGIENLTNLRQLICFNNQLTELIIPEGCEYVECQYNNLIKLIIPENCEFIGCVNNKLNKLIVPKGCIFIYCGNNNIHPIVVDLFKSEDPVKIQLANSLQLANNLQR